VKHREKPQPIGDATKENISDDTTENRRYYKKELAILQKGNRLGALNRGIRAICVGLAYGWRESA